jgi:hypothetical protein
MTNAQLIRHLQKLDPNKQVVLCFLGDYAEIYRVVDNESVGSDLVTVIENGEQIPEEE